MNRLFSLSAVLQRIVLAICFIAFCHSAQAELLVDVGPIKITGQKAVVPLRLVNGFSEKIEAARAVVFIIDEKGKMAGQAAKWVVGGGGKDKLALSSGQTNSFNFVVPTARSLTVSNLTAKVSFSRIVLEGGKVPAGTNNFKVTNSQ